MMHKYANMLTILSNSFPSDIHKTLPSRQCVSQQVVALRNVDFATQIKCLLDYGEGIALSVSYVGKINHLYSARLKIKL